jgi:hypothetical protein
VACRVQPQGSSALQASLVCFILTFIVVNGLFPLNTYSLPPLAPAVASGGRDQLSMQAQSPRYCCFSPSCQQLRPLAGWPNPVCIGWPAVQKQRFWG